jgi:O-antigen ligase
LLTVLAGALLIDATTSLDLPAMALAAALPAIPFGLYLLLKGIGGDKTYGVLLAVVVLLALTVNFRTRAFDNKDMDFQVALRLVAIAGMYAMSLLFLRKLIRRGNTALLSSWLCFFTYTMLTSGYAINSGHALVSTASLLGAFLFVYHLCIQYGGDRAAWVVGTAAAIVFLTSLCVYFAVPSFGRMSDWVGNDYVVTARLQGVLGSSNGAGMASAAGLFLIVTFLPSDSMRARIWKYVGAASALLCLLLSHNRMAMFALLASVMTFFVLNGPIARNALAVFAIALFAASCIVLFADDLMTLVSRSSNEAEILTLTGRTRIWAAVIDLWRQLPILGYGFGSALYILPVHPDLFPAAAHSHNLYLEQLFSGGLIGFGLFACSTVITIMVAWRMRAVRELSLIIFFLIYGVTEPVIYGPVSFPLVIMILAIARVLSGPSQRGAPVPN